MRISHIQTKYIAILAISIIKFCQCVDTQDLAFDSDGQQSPTALKKIEESRQSSMMLQKLPNLSLTREYSFELSPKRMEQFYLDIPTNCPIGMMITLLIYDESNDLYSEISDIDRFPAVKMTLFENNNRVVAESTFYFRSAVVLEGKAGGTYHIRFYTTGTAKKLLLVRHNPLVESWDADKLIMKQQLAKYAGKAQNIGINIQSSVKSLKSNHVLFKQDERSVMRVIDQYFKFQITEAVLVVGICLLQVKVIGNLLKPGAII